MNDSTKLEEVQIGGESIIINPNCFKNCQSLSKFSIIKSRQIEFKEKQFIECNRLENISIQCSIVNIYQNQICNCKSLKNINIESNSQISLEEAFFTGFNNLEKISISGENILIKDNCFRNCPNLKNIELIKAKSFILFSIVFQNCIKLIEINLISDFELICGKDCFCGSYIQKAQFHSKLVKLENSCFENHIFNKSLIESIDIISENLTICDNCFNGCQSLKSLSIISKKCAKYWQQCIQWIIH